MPQTLQHLRLTGKSLDDIHPNVMPIPEQLVEDTYFRIDRQEILQISTIKSLRSLSCVFDNLYNIFVLDQLPHLEILTIKVSTFLEKAEIEALKMLFIGLATKPEQTLKRLDISGLTIDLPLSNEMAKIQSLQKLGCKFLNPESIEPLSKLYQLHTLEIKSTHDFNSFSQAILQILTLTNSGSFKIEFELLYSSIFYRNDLKKIELQLDPETDATTFAALGDWEIYLKLNIVKECKAGSLLSLFETLSKRKNHKLTHLYIKDMPINYKETLLISEIKSLQEIGCSFSDPRSIKLLHRLTALELIILKDRILAIDIVSFLNSFQQQEIMIEHGNRKIIYNKSRGSLNLKNNSLDGKVHDYSDYACLGKLDHLKTLRIAGKNNSFSLQKLLKNIALRANLSELIIEKEDFNEFTTGKSNVVENIQVATPAITPDEVMEIVKIRPLKTLKCGFSKSQNIELLAELKELKNLTITRHQAGSLQSLFEKIAMQTSTALEFLSIEENALTLNELRPLAGIKTLKRLEVNSISTENQDGLPTFVHLKELIIRSHHGETLFIEPEPSFDSVLESIIIMGDPLGVQDVIALAQYKSLRKLQVNLQQFMRIDLLSSLCKLEVLNIQLLGSETHSSGSMIPKYPSNLRKLNLQSVDCIVDEAAIEPLALLEQLETLSITLPKNTSLVALLQALAQKSILKHLIINRKLLDSDEELNLKEITSLNSVQCGFLNDAFFYDLQNLINLKSVTVTSHHDFINISEPLLNFLKYCTRFDSIDLPNCNGEFDENFLMKAKSILEKIRCPITQKPLELRMGSPTNFDQ
ncbi:uncharacterized protein LOC26529009 [Drosophila willistoni]|uniref:uncharacterized protein LOC26529009 n=1 Tax=Drosophila willistoni TaxID=7260 RepID=UPI001F07C139|nr:uncharacterized protein LOC26529009 [Drosophila willistoni]